MKDESVRRHMQKTTSRKSSTSTSRNSKSKDDYEKLEQEGSRTERLPKMRKCISIR
jgi:hypothetical protein